jgi:hypothetical protein
MGGGKILWVNVSLIKRGIFYGYGRMRIYEYKPHR